MRLKIPYNIRRGINMSKRRIKQWQEQRKIYSKLSTLPKFNAKLNRGKAYENLNYL